MKKILIVDDDSTIRSMVCTILATPMRSFSEATNGTEALRALEMEMFDLIISDVIMPNCDGIELIMSIRAKYPNLPVVIVSGGGRVNATHYLGLAEKLGAVKVFEKPFDVQLLRDGVTELLGDNKSEGQNNKI